MLKPEEMLAGFKVVCKECSGENITITSDMGFSAESGTWGGLSMECLDCHNSKEIYENW